MRQIRKKRCYLFAKLCENWALVCLHVCEAYLWARLCNFKVKRTAVILSAVWEIYTSISCQIFCEVLYYSVSLQKTKSLDICYCHAADAAPAATAVTAAALTLQIVGKKRKI